MAVPTTAPELLALIERSELLDKARLAPYYNELQQPDCVIKTAKDCAQALIKQNQLTIFQAKLLLQGKWRNFFIGTKYKVLDHLGSGGMGTVFLCEHRFMRRRVAIKLLPVDKSMSGGLERFRREAQATARLNHPNIVQAHDIDQDGMMHFMVMEYIDGISLQQLVTNRGPLSIERAVNYICQASQGLAHAHKMSLVHRDIKPSNLLLDRTGCIKILDLGLVRIENSQDNLTQMMDSKTVLGTADYLAPEQAISSTVDIRADIYSMGCMFYFLLTGKPPFADGNIAQKMIKHQIMNPDPISSIRRDVSAKLDEVILSMMAKRPDHRPQTPMDVYHLLAPWFVPVEPPSTDELPLFRFSHHRDVDTLSKLSTMSSIPVATHSQVVRMSQLSKS